MDFTDAAELVSGDSTDSSTTSACEGSRIIQTGPSHSVGEWSDLDLETLRCQVVVYAMPWIRSASTPPDWISFLIPLCEKSFPLLQGRRVGPSQVVILGTGSDLFEVVEATTRGKSLQISVHLGRLHLEYLARYGTGAPDLSAVAEVLDLGVEPADWLRSMDEVETSIRCANPFHREGKSALEEALLDIVLRATKTFSELQFRSGAKPRHDAALQRCWKYIDQNLERPISLEDLSRASGYSERQLQFIFHCRLGIPPLDYIRNYRLQEARNKLRSGAESVKEAALSCGLTELGRFSVRYREVFGESPSDTLRNRTAPRALGTGGKDTLQPRSARGSVLRSLEATSSVRNTSADAVQAGWRSGQARESGASRRS